MDQQVDTSYTGSGFNMFMERPPQTFLANERLNGLISPFIQQTDENGYLFSPFSDMTSQTTDAMFQQQPLSANNIQGGTLTSDSGNLTIDLNTGNLAFTDPTGQQVLNVGGQNADGSANGVSLFNPNISTG